MSRQIPRGEAHLNCPLWQKPMEEVCHKCPWWTQIRGRHPQTGGEIDSWQCAVGALPMLLVENAQQTRQAGAATESFRNVMVQLHSQSQQVLARLEPNKEERTWPPAILNGR